MFLTNARNSNCTSGRVIRFPQRHSKEEHKTCIFCGQNANIHTFKGKTVCINCLRHIPALFIYV